MSTIILPEDNGAVLQILRPPLRLKGGYCVLQAISQREALNHFEHGESEIDLLLTDVYVDGQNSTRLPIRWITLCPQLRLPFISGCSRDHLAGNGDLSSDLFPEKPFSLDTFLRGVGDVLDGSYKAQMLNSRSHASVGDEGKIKV